jgi:hypothetical protein
MTGEAKSVKMVKCALIPVLVAVVALSVGGCANGRRVKPPPRHDLSLQLSGGPGATTQVAVLMGSAVIPLGVVGVPNRTTGVDVSSITVTLYPDDEEVCLVEWRDLFAEASHADSHQFFRVVRLDQAKTTTLLAGDWLLAASGNAAGARTITRADGARVPLALSISGTCQILHKTGWIGVIRTSETRGLRSDDAQAPAMLIDAFRLITWYRIEEDHCRHDSSSFVDLLLTAENAGPSAAEVVEAHPWLSFGATIAHDPAWFTIVAEPPLSGDHPCVDTGGR